jgi:hypothetical protein
MSSVIRGLDESDEFDVGLRAGAACPLTGAQFVLPLQWGNLKVGADRPCSEGEQR